MTQEELISKRGSPAWKGKKVLPALVGLGWIRSYTLLKLI
jgi:hypothetical protein